MDHSNCYLSSGICGSITAGQGKLDENGYFEIPCIECASRAEEYIGTLSQSRPKKITTERDKG